MRKVMVSLLAVFIIASLVLAGCSSASSTTTSAPATSATTTVAPTTSVSTEPIKIGIIVSMTGDSALVGPGEKAAVQYRLDQVGNKVAGRPIQLVVADDASSPTTGVDAAKKLLLNDNVDVILGPTQGASAVAVGNYMKTASPAVPTFIVMAKSGKLLDGAVNNNVFLPMGTDVSTGYYLGLYAADTLKYKVVATLLEDMISGWDKVGAFDAGFTKQGGSDVQQQTIPTGGAAVDLSSYLANLKTADAIAIWCTPGLITRFVTAYYGAGKTMPLLIPDSSVLLSKQLTGIGAKSVGIVSEINYTTLIDTPMNNAYVADFLSKNGSVPTTQGGAIDQALQVYLAAVVATGGDTSPAKINPAIHKVKIATPAGTISFTPQGLGIGDLYIAKSVQLADRIDWQPIFTYQQITLDAPVAAR